ncbi:MAG: MBL fold metallo-hydrolase [Lachnospiraceae bacterium]|nr:MBL fold metallo-hydrolase [Lachnospiraceae bacterium]
MKLTVLVDNTTYTGETNIGEPGACYFIEDDDKKILLDTGFSDVCLKNAEKLGVDLGSVTDIILSHGHNDHTGGLRFLPEKLKNGVTITAHPDMFDKKYHRGKEIGCPVSSDELSKKYNLRLSATPIKISKNITFLGYIQRTNDFENKTPVGKFESGGELKDDYLTDDSAIVYESKDGIYIISGCSHSGICNIIEYSKKVTGNNNVLGVLGGFHLLEKGEQLQKTIEYFKEKNITNLYPCHCVCFKARSEIDRNIPITDVAVGFMTEW